MDLEKARPAPVAGRHGGVGPAVEPEGCLAVAVRVPVRIVVLVLVVPVRLLWDLLAIAGRATHRVLLRPLGNGLSWLFEHAVLPAMAGLGWLLRFTGRLLFLWPWVALWRYVVVPVAVYGIGVPARWVYRQLLTPLGHGLLWVGTNLVAAPAVWFYRRALTPLGRGTAVTLRWVVLAVFVWPWVALWRYVVVPVAVYGIAVPAQWVYRQLLTPLGHATLWLLTRVGGALDWALAYLLFKPLVWLFRYAVFVPLAALWRYVLKPVGGEIVSAVGVAWRVAGYLVRALGDAFLWFFRTLLAPPARWFYQHICTPVGHMARDALWRPAKRAAVEAGQAARSALRSAREAVRQARQSAWRAMGRGVRVPEPVEPGVPSARTLGSTKTVSGAAAGPEVSLHKRG
ncbi:hypothetical protein ACWEFL_06880 [Streptomyces sp. NPDC004838]